MLYKNAFKLVLSNNNLIWKVLLFFIVNALIIFGLLYAFSLPIIQVLKANNWFIDLKDIYMNFITHLNLQTLLNDIVEAFANFISIINANLDKLFINIFFFIFTLVVLSSFLNGFYGLVIANVLYYFMSNNMRYGFIASFIETFGKNLKYNIIQLVTRLPLNIVIYGIAFLMLGLFAYGGLIAFFTPFLIILVFILLRAIKLTYFTSWAPSIIVFNKNMGYNIDKGLKVTRRKLGKIFTSSLYIILTIFAVNIFCAIVTFGVSLIFTIPFSIILVSCYNMVVFYSSYGMRYYVDEYNVIVPKKMEHTDYISSVKYIV